MSFHEAWEKFAGQQGFDPRSQTPRVSSLRVVFTAGWQLGVEDHAKASVAQQATAGELTDQYRWSEAREAEAHSAYKRAVEVRVRAGINRDLAVEREARS